MPVNVKIHTDEIERKVLEAAADEIREKLREAGLPDVGVNVVIKDGKQVVEFLGSPEDKKKAGDLFGT